MKSVWLSWLLNSLLCVLILCTAVNATDKASKELPPKIRSLQLKWREFRDKVATAELELHRMELRPIDGPGATSVEAIVFFREMMDSIDDGVGKFDDIESKVEAFRKNHGMAGGWEKLTIISDGTILRNESVQLGSGSGAARVRVRSSQGEVVFNPKIHQATVKSRPGHIEMVKVEDVRYIPDRMNPKRFIEMTTDSDESAVIRMKNCDFTVNLATAMVKELEYYVSDGDPRLIILQSNKLLDVIDSPFPKCSVRMYFKTFNGKNLLSSAEVSIVKSAHLNLPISTKKFDVAVPEDVVVVKLDENDQLELSMRSDKSADDARTLASELKEKHDKVYKGHNSAKISREPLTPSASGSWWKLLFVLNVVFAIFVLLLWKNKR